MIVYGAHDNVRCFLLQNIRQQPVSQKMFQICEGGRFFDGDVQVVR